MSSNELMSINWQKMIKPEKVQVTSDPSYGKFVCEPLERGFGITIGNSLRRIILSSLYGAAIVSIKIDGVMHEFSVIEGIYEDVSEIILNLKEVRFKVSDPEPKTVRIDIEGKGEVTAGNIISDDGRCEVINSDQHIATLSDGAKLKMNMTVKTEKGYSLSEANKDEDAPLGTIPIDSVFSPIKRVTYVVGNARVGQRTDYDKLTLEVWTDGSILPEDAVAYAAKILKEQMTHFINFDEDIEPEPEKKVEEKEKIKFNENLYKSVEELE
ncbi:MAG: DNA-directed RNA polymerase subunit alpha, partial [Desulfobacterales bacterium]